MEKKWLIISILLVCMAPKLPAQIKAFEKLYPKIVFEEIEVIGANGEALKEKEIFNLFFQVDTFTSESGLMEQEFIENVYTSSSVQRIVNKKELDTVKSMVPESKIGFVEILRSDIGEYQGKKKTFNLDAKVVNNLEKPIKYKSSKNDQKLITRKKEYWAVSENQTKDEKIYIDDCHQKHQLLFLTKKKYSQTYQGKTECQTSIDEEKLEKEGYFNYWGNELIHKIDFQEGKWKTKDHKLYLTNTGENKVKIISYQIKKDVLILKPKPNYKIILKKKRK